MSSYKMENQDKNLIDSIKIILISFVQKVLKQTRYLFDRGYAKSGPINTS